MPVLERHTWQCLCEAGACLNRLIELWLATGDRVRARLESERFLEMSLAAEERTSQGLAWKINARVALANRTSTSVASRSRSLRIRWSNKSRCEKFSCRRPLLPFTVSPGSFPLSSESLMQIGAPIKTSRWKRYPPP
jgi:hypothetical protein